MGEQQQRDRNRAASEEHYASSHFHCGCSQSPKPKKAVLRPTPIFHPRQMIRRSKPCESCAIVSPVCRIAYHGRKACGEALFSCQSRRTTAYSYETPCGEYPARIPSIRCSYHHTKSEKRKC